MKFLLLFPLFLALPAMADFHCVAEAERNDGKGFQEKPLEPVAKLPSGRKWSADLGDAYFSVAQDEAAGDFLLLISRGPAYQDGVTLRGSPNRRGELRGALVGPEVTYRVRCAN